MQNRLAALDQQIAELQRQRQAVADHRTWIGQQRPVQEAHNVFGRLVDVCEIAPRSTLTEDIDRLAAQDGTALLHIRLQTGRKHQIRVQLAHAGWPILYDMRYGAGVGVRWQSPVGPIKLDFAVPVGDKEEHGLQFYIGLGPEL